MKFKIGDIVNIINRNYYGTIKSVNLTDYTVIVNVNGDEYTYWYKDYDLELFKRPIFNKENLTPHKIEKKDPIVEKVRQKLLDRSRLGIKKYGTTLEENNTDDFLVHALEEAMDLALYLQKEIDNRK